MWNVFKLGNAKQHQTHYVDIFIMMPSNYRFGHLTDAEIVCICLVMLD